MRLAQDSMDQLFDDLRKRKELSKALSIKRLAARYKVSERTIKRAQRMLEDAELPTGERATAK